MAAPHQTLLSLSDVQHVFRLPSGKELQVLADINLQLAEGELVAILGPSGCGKSTLIRIATGLLAPTRGRVLSRGVPIDGPNPRAALVFQQFALFPWLTVAQNLEQALIPRGMAPAARRKRVAEIVTLVGLDGFEEAYPRELSGGMKQRVGIGRALAVEPELLCMDEPFSQVDALTAEALRNEVLHLWQDRAQYPRAICLVSHDIHEVAFMATRILVMAANPGRIKTVLENPLPYPRMPQSPAYQAFVDQLHGIITGLYIPHAAPAVAPSATLAEATAEARAEAQAPSTITPIPLVGVGEIIGLLESVHQRGGAVEFFRLTGELGRGFTRILLAVKAAEVLGLLETPGDRLVLTELGSRFVAAPRRARQQLFAQQAGQVPLIRRVLDLAGHETEGRLAADVLLQELAIQCPLEEPRRLFHVLMNWGRFANLWTHSAAAKALTLNHGAPNGGHPGLPGR